jgi:tRNA-dihydrouridine synthase
MSDFWKQLNSPIMALAPMEDVTDTVFREMILGISHPDAIQVMMTEFVSTDGMCHKRGREKVIHRLRVNDSERALLKLPKSGFLACQGRGRTLACPPSCFL